VTAYDAAIPPSTLVNGKSRFDVACDADASASRDVESVTSPCCADSETTLSRERTTAA
jgi:hypothetical protein